MNIELKDLVGEHLLTGVDFSNESIKTYGNQFEQCQVINFTLDGQTYTACEDPDDGYRSSMEYLRKSEKPTTNTFAPVTVIGRLRANGPHQINDTIEFLDAKNGKIILAVGTDNTDDYYPYFVSEFTPENMSCNEGR